MAKYVMVVQSQAKEGRDDEYNKWYDTEHFADIAAIPGIVGGRRFEATPVGLGAPMLPYLAIFDVEIDDPSTILAEMGRRAASGEMVTSDALDAQATVLRFLKVHEPVV